MRGVDSEDFWSGYQPGFRFARAPVGTRMFFDEVTAQRYETEPHIPEVVQFERWPGTKVLEAGCGIGTDGAEFAAAGAHYTGLDASPTALGVARRRFELEDLDGNFVQGSVTQLPFRDASFDLVFSHGVIHHVEDTAAAVREFYRILRPGGVALVMVYHRTSFNYYVTLMGLRRALVSLLLLPGAIPAVSRATGEPQHVLFGHKRLLSQHGLRYLADRKLFLSNNTDGPGNPLSKVYTKSEFLRLVPPEAKDVRTEVRYLNLRLYPGGSRFARTRVGTRLERIAGWHLYVRFVKGSSGASPPNVPMDVQDDA